MSAESNGCNGSEATVPDDLARALTSEARALAAWEGLTPIGRRDFVAWINEAKQAATRARRIERCCENLAAGKRRPCCYAVVPMDFYQALGQVPPAKAQWSTLTSDERRNLTDWISEAPDRIERKARISEATTLLTQRKRSR
jgi:uncharacterized protein YdeI (YjbR/CyaY-like superfamily)